jgi:hypothetical protein
MTVRDLFATAANKERGNWGQIVCWNIISYHVAVEAVDFVVRTIGEV